MITRRALTIVEMLVSIGIVAILLAITLPAVQQARESVQRVSCANNLRQIASAIQSHESLHRHLPTGGWGWRWTGDPDRGFAQDQPGGWTYNVLPFLEQNDLRTIGAGFSGPYRADQLSAVNSQPIPIFSCPTRRSAGLFRFVHSVDFVNITRPKNVARGDYAACSGDVAPDPSWGKGRGPSSLAEGDSGTFFWHETQGSGLVYRRSQVLLGQISDGLSNTYLVGEKFVSVADYYSGKAQNDDQSLFVGYDSDTLRTTDLNYPPVSDVSSVTSDHSFGSAHGSGFNMAMADGSVSMISFHVNLNVHQTRGNRMDGGVVSSSH
jgi:prepilin-type processing-associated H-X9-DG protein